METVVSNYCGKAHRLVDGEPVAHRCRVIPPEGLKAEVEGDIETYIKNLEIRPFVLSNGVPAEEKHT